MNARAERELATLVAEQWPDLAATHAGLRSLAAWGRRHHDLRGVFASAYLVVTDAILAALASACFDDPTWISCVVLDFAERYRVALHDDLRGEAVGCWQRALQRTRGGSLASIVALLHAMIAHIHFDLAHTLHACGPIDARRRGDYERLGSIICATTSRIQHELLADHAAALRDLHDRLRGSDTRLTAALVARWRRRALHVALGMARSPQHASAWTRRLALESAMLGAGLDLLAWPLERLDSSPTRAREALPTW